MIKIIKNIYEWVTRKLRMILLSLLIGISNVELQIFKSSGNKSSFGGGVITRMLYRSTLLEKLVQGKHDEQYVQKFYEILKKADNFMRKSTPHKLGVSADTYAKTLGKKDKYGRRYDHYGFFDEKHKHHGKTLEEVFEIELEERRTKDDNYKLIKVIDNKPLDVGLSKVVDVVREVKDKDGKVVYLVDDLNKKSKLHKFPIIVIRKNKNCTNKIEELTEFLHIKEKFFDHKRFEFFIPLKFKTHTFNDDDKIIKDILNVDEFYVRDDYGELIGYSIKKFIKRFKHNDIYDVFRFDGIEMKKIE
jgi:ribosome-binding protein aMBF1 (putative translation factor)